MLVLVCAYVDVSVSVNQLFPPSNPLDLHVPSFSSFSYSYEHQHCDERIRYAYSAAFVCRSEAAAFFDPEAEELCDVVCLLYFREKNNHAVENINLGSVPSPTPVLARHRSQTLSPHLALVRRTA